MLVTERMQALGDHAKSSRQPPLKERKRAKEDESAAKTVELDEDIFDNGAAHESAALKPHPAADGTGHARTIQEDADLSAAKRAIIHEWENWSALHSDELDDPNVAEYFFRHLKMKRPSLSTLGSQETWSIVRG